ncbi:MAG TPA: hypothetical protein VJM33_17620 [Microthrixaceae bacterium]|nr:hypothetical protein [Microthrixaceae bacterium]
MGGAPLSVRPAVIVLALLVIAIATGSAWWAGSRGPTVYGAEAELLVHVASGEGDPEADRRLATQLVVLDGGNVVRPAAEQLDMSPAELRRRLDTSVVDGSQVVRIQASAGSRERAAQIVDVVVDSYLDQPADAASEESEEYLVSELEAISTRRAAVSQELLALAPSSATAAQQTALQSELTQLSQQESTLQDQIVATRLEQIRTGQPAVVTPPSAMSRPLAPTPARSAALGAIAGLTLAGALVLWSMRRSRPVVDEP